MKSTGYGDISRREFFVLLPLCLLTIIFGVWPNIVLDLLHNSVLSMIGPTIPLYVTSF